MKKNILYTFALGCLSLSLSSCGAYLSAGVDMVVLFLYMTMDIMLDTAVHMAELDMKRRDDRHSSYQTRWLMNLD